jgi:hypothetical protein
MLKKRMISLGFILGLLINASFAAKNINLTLGSGIDFHFKANQSQVFTNTFPWVLNVECTLYCDDALHNALEFIVLKKNGSLNDMPVYVGDTMSMDIHPFDKFKISAVSGARVQLINKGEGEVTAICNITN